MKSLFKALSLAAIVTCGVALVTSCDDTGQIGSSLVTTQNTIHVEDGFTVTGQSVDNSRVPSRTSMQLIGDIIADDYGSLQSDYVTQFLPVAELDSNLRSSDNIDSVKMLLMFKSGNFVGDSIVPMGLEIFRLNRQLTAPLYSDFPVAEYYSTDDLLGSKVYGASNLELATDSVSKLAYREIYVDMPLSLGRELFDIYKTDPASYLAPTSFAKHFPGVYVRTNYGSGRVTQIGATIIQLYYHYNTKNDAGRDTIINTVGNFYSATPEVISNNILAYKRAASIDERLARGEKLIVAPAGLDVEMRFPLPEVIQYYQGNRGELSVINSLEMSIPAAKISNTFGIEPPHFLLMVLKKDYDKFFEKSQVTDGIHSFYAIYDEATNSYNFSAMRDYLLEALGKESISADDYTFVLTPVSLETEAVYNSNTGTQESYITNLTPYVQQPVMARLDLDKAKVTLTFSTQNAPK